MRRLGIWVLVGALCISFIQIYLEKDAPAPNSLVCSHWKGFVYRAPWNTAGQLTVINKDVRGILWTDGFDSILLKRLEKGCYVQFDQVTLRPASAARNPGVLDYRRYLQSRNVTYICDAKAEDIQIQARIPLRFWLRFPGTVFRYYAKDTIYQYLDLSSGRFVYSVMTGDTGDLSDAYKEIFRAGGLSHIMAVSGMHVAFVVRPFRKLFQRKCLSYRKRNALLLFPIFLFMMLTDFTPSVMRAGICMMGLVLSRVLVRPPDGVNFLLLSAGIQILINPFVLFGAGFLMSYGAAVSLYFVLPILTKRFLFFQGKGRILTAGIAVNIVLAPLMLYLFGAFSVCGILLTILVTVPVGFVCTLGYLLCMIRLVPVIRFLCRPIAYVLYFLCKCIEILAHIGAKLPAPFGQISIPGVSVWILIGYYVLLLSIVVFWKRAKRFAVCVICFVVTLSGYCIYTSPVLQILFIDVGQGAAVLVKADGVVGMIDTGDGNTDLTAILHKQGLKRLDFVVLTHGHEDHTGGFMQVAEAFSPRVLYTSGNNESGLADAKYQASTQGISVQSVSDGSTVSCGKVTMQFFVCESFYGQKSETGENNASLNVFLTCAYGSVTVCGDLEQQGVSALLQKGSFAKSDVLFVPHHGSESGTSEKMLSYILPKYAIISVGHNNSYGHPGKGTLECLQNAGAKIYRTDMCGGITVMIGKKTLFRKRCVEIWQML